MVNVNQILIVILIVSFVLLEPQETTIQTFVWDVLMKTVLLVMEANVLFAMMAIIPIVIVNVLLVKGTVMSVLMMRSV